MKEFIVDLNQWTFYDIVYYMFCVIIYTYIYTYIIHIRFYRCIQYTDTDTDTLAYTSIHVAMQP